MTKKKEKKKKKVPEVRREIDAFLHERNRGEIDSFLKEKEKRKKGRQKNARKQRILLVTIIYFIFAIPAFFFVILPSNNYISLVIFLVLGYIGLLLVAYFLAEWIDLHRTNKIDKR